MQVWTGNQMHIRHLDHELNPEPLGIAPGKNHCTTRFPYLDFTQYNMKNGSTFVKDNRQNCCTTFVSTKYRKLINTTFIYSPSVKVRASLISDEGPGPFWLNASTLKPYLVYGFKPLTV